MPLNVFEPRYLAMIDGHAGRQAPDGHGAAAARWRQAARWRARTVRRRLHWPADSFNESGDGRYRDRPAGVCRFRIDEEIAGRSGYRQCRIRPFAADFDESAGAEDVDRPALLKTFRNYLSANDLEADWGSISRAENATLVNALSMMAPYGAAEKAGAARGARPQDARRDADCDHRNCNGPRAR